MDVTIYTLEDAEGNEVGLGTWYQLSEYDDARDRAQREGLKVIENTFEFADSCVVDDFTDGKDGRPDD